MASGRFDFNKTVTGIYCMVLNFECINIIYIDMLGFVFYEQQLHPHIYSLGALLRLYGRSSWKSVKEKKVYYLLNQSS